jgi:hypothetical protein
MLRVKSISMCTFPGRCDPTCYFYSKPIVSTRFWFVNPKPETWKLPPEIYRFRRHLQTMCLRISSRNIYRTISSRKSRTSTRKNPPKPWKCLKISCVLLEIRWHLQDIPRISTDNSKTPDVPTWQKTLPGAFSAPADVNDMRLRSLKKYWGKNTPFLVLGGSRYLDFQLFSEEKRADFEKHVFLND